MKIRYLPVAAGLVPVGAAALLIGPLVAFVAMSGPRSNPEVQSAAEASALPVSVGAGDIPWVIGPTGLGGSTGNLGWTVNDTFGGGNFGSADAASILQTANQLGPLTFNAGNLKTISFSQTPSVTNPTGTQPDFNAGDMTSWLVGSAAVGGSAGIVGWTADNTFGGGNGGVADVAGTLRTANQFGPAFFNLDVLKSLTFSQPPNGAVLPNGQTDDIHAVDIGQWSAGLPGVITNTGTTGFVADRGYGVGFGTADYVGGLHTTTQVGSMTFDFNFLPAISFPPPSVGMAPNLTDPAFVTLTSTPAPDPSPAAAPVAAVSPNAAGPSSPGTGNPNFSTPSSGSPSSIGASIPRTLGPGTAGHGSNGGATTPSSTSPSASNPGPGSLSPGAFGPGTDAINNVVTGILSRAGMGANPSSGTGAGAGSTGASASAGG